MKEETARIGIIGLGRAGRVHLEAWQLVPGANVVAIADPATEARAYARSAGYRTYSSAEKMLERERLDAVSIVTPPADHATAAIASVKHGVHVLCEKPFALNTWDVFRMLQAAQDQRRLLLLATKFRHVPALRAAQDLIRERPARRDCVFRDQFLQSRGHGCTMERRSNDRRWWCNHGQRMSCN
jgi:Predicted dehydrogenases and related proteins